MCHTLDSTVARGFLLVRKENIHANGLFPIGKPISGPLAGIYIAWLEEMFGKNGNFTAQIIIWRRMKDTVFFSWWVDKSVTPDDFKGNLNSIESK